MYVWCSIQDNITDCDDQAVCTQFESPKKAKRTVLSLDEEGEDVDEWEDDPLDDEMEIEEDRDTTLVAKKLEEERKELEEL